MALHKSRFFVRLVIILSFPARLEAFNQALRGFQLDILKVCNHIQNLLLVFRCHRQNTEERFKRFFQKQKNKLKVSLSIYLFHDCAHTSKVEEYLRKFVFAPYPDSILSSLEIQLSA